MASRRRGAFRWSIPIGRVAGVEVAVHLSFFLLVFLVFAAPGGALDEAVWILLVFACVLVHELAHSLVTRVRGGVVRGIVLLPIGGVSQIERLPQGWANELLVAAAGPLTSAGLAVLAGVGTVATGGHLWPASLTAGPLLPRLAWANLLLAGFNLLPAYPLDGGRVLRSLLERRHPPEWATRVAAQVGRVAGGLMMLLSLLVGDLWLLVIGLFVVLGATQEETLALAHARLAGVPVRELMRSPPPLVDARQLVPVTGSAWPGPRVVTLDGHVYGVVDGRTLAAARAGTVADRTDTDTGEVAPDEDLGRSGLDTLLASPAGAVPVIDDGEVVGILLVADISAWLRGRPQRAW